MNDLRRRVVTGSLIALLLVLALPAAAAARSESPASTRSVAAAGPRPAVSDGSYACTVPSGYVYDSAARTSQCTSSLTYHLRVPADGVWSCAGPYVSVPAGFTFDLTLVSSGQCDPSNRGLWKYQLRVPVNGLWACLVPAGFTSDQVIRSDRCNPGYAYANLYHLRG